MEAVVVKAREENRTTDDASLTVRCFVGDPTDVETVDCVLEDHFERRQTITVPKTTMLILVPVGTLGDVPFDPSRDARGVVEQIDGRYVFRQRTTLSNSDVHRQVYAILTEMAKRNETGVVLAGKFPK